MPLQKVVDLSQRVFRALKEGGMGAEGVAIVHCIAGDSPRDLCALIHRGDHIEKAADDEHGLLNEGQQMVYGVGIQLLETGLGLGIGLGFGSRLQRLKTSQPARHILRGLAYPPEICL